VVAAHLDAEGSGLAVGDRPLRALGGCPEDVGAGKVAGVFPVEVDARVFGLLVVVGMYGDSEGPVVGREG